MSKERPTNQEDLRRELDDLKKTASELLRRKTAGRETGSQLEAPEETELVTQSTAPIEAELFDASKHPTEDAEMVTQEVEELKEVEQEEMPVAIDVIKEKTSKTSRRARVIKHKIKKALNEEVEGSKAFAKEVGRAGVELKDDLKDLAGKGIGFTKKVANEIKKGKDKLEGSISGVRALSDISMRGQEEGLPHLEAEIKTEIKSLPQPEREKLAKGIHNIGFIIERNKNDFFAKTFDSISKKQSDKKGTIARFTAGLRDSFKKDGDAAQKKAKAGKDASGLTKLSNVAYLAKNFLRPLRLIADATGISPGGAQRLVMAGAMISGRVTGAMKEARLANEEVLEKNRIDIDKAIEEAWTVYENAQNRAGSDSNVSAEELQTAYLHEIPKDLQERLKNPTAANGMVQGLLRKHLSFDIDRLNEDILEIEADDELSPAKKKAETEQLMRRWEKRLTDYDRVLTQAGTVDEYAMAARYAESTSKNVVRVMTIQTLYLSAEKLWGGISHLFGSQEVHEVVTAIKAPAFNQRFPGTENPGVGDATHTIHPSAGGKDPEMSYQKIFGPEKSPEVAVEPTVTTETETPVENTEAISTPPTIPSDPVIATVTPETITEAPIPKVSTEELIEKARQQVEQNMSDPQITIDEYGNYNYIDPNSEVIPPADIDVENIVLPGKPPVGDVFTETHTHTDNIPAPTIKLDPLHDVLKTGVAGQSPNDMIQAYHPPTNVPNDYPQSPNNVIHAYNQPMNMPNHYNGPNDAIRPYNQPMNIRGGYNQPNNMGGMMQEVMPSRQMEMISNQNIQHIFPENTAEKWDLVGGTSANQILEITPESAEGQGLTNLVSYMERLKEVTGLEPKGRSLFNWKPESVADYFKRATEWAARNGKLEDIKIL